MSTTRRGMLQAFGVDIADIPVAELDQPSAPTLGSLEGWSIREISIRHHTSEIDVTRFCDTEPVYVTGLSNVRNMRVYLTVEATELALASKAKRAASISGLPQLHLDEVIGDRRFVATLGVISCNYTMPINGMVTAHFKCSVLDKAAEWLPLTPEEPAIPYGRRGMAL